LDYTSLYDSGGAYCPPSEFPLEDLLPTDTMPSGASIHIPGVVMGVSVVAATLATLIM
jgi:hypothetical protein